MLPQSNWAKFFKGYGLTNENTWVQIIGWDKEAERLFEYSEDSTDFTYVKCSSLSVPLSANQYI